MASVSKTQNHPEGAAGPLLSAIGETPDVNWQVEAQGPEGSVPVTALRATEGNCQSGAFGTFLVSNARDLGTRRGKFCRPYGARGSFYVAVPGLPLPFAALRVRVVLG